MTKSIVNVSYRDYQLISIGIELVHNVMAIQDCVPEIFKNPHVAKISALASKWNEMFIESYLLNKEGNII